MPGNCPYLLCDFHMHTNRDDLFAVTQPEALPVHREQRLPQAEAPAFVEDADPCREELGSHQGSAPEQRRHRDHAVPQRRVEQEGKEAREGRARRGSRTRRELNAAVGPVPGPVAQEVLRRVRQRGIKRRAVALLTAVAGVATEFAGDPASWTPNHAGL